jgi:hypothetical protein
LAVYTPLVNIKACFFDSEVSPQNQKTENSHTNDVKASSAHCQENVTDQVYIKVLVRYTLLNKVTLKSAKNKRTFSVCVSRKQ